MKTCPSCAKENQGAATFCTHCGTKLPTSARSEEPLYWVQVGSEQFSCDLDTLRRWVREGRVTEIHQVYDPNCGKWQPAVQIGDLNKDWPRTLTKCPFCAEFIQAEAVLCKHCGRDFSTGKAPAKQIVIKEKRKTSPFASGCLTLLVMMMFMGWCVIRDTGAPETARKPRTTSPSKGQSAKRTSPRNILSPEESSAVGIVAPQIGANKLGITREILMAMENPKGDGAFVYVPQTLFYGIERHIFWIVVDGKCYVLNGSTKNITPNVPWAREAPEAVWARTNLNIYNATDTSKLIWPESVPSAGASDEDTVTPAISEPAQLEVKTIPGLTTNKITNHVKSLGFSCESPKSDGSYRVWNCEKGRISEQNYIVDVTGDTKGNFLSVSTYTFPGNKAIDKGAAIAMLSSIAGFSYENADPDRVKEWIKDSILAGKLGAELEIGGMVFSLLVPDPPNLDIAVKGF